MEEHFGFAIEIVKCCDSMQGIVVLAKLWIVERSLGRMTYCRRLSKDYEGHPHLSWSWMLWAMINNMLYTLEIGL